MAPSSRDSSFGHVSVPLHISPPTSIPDDDDPDVDAAAAPDAEAADDPTASSTPHSAPPVLLHTLNHDSPVLAVAVSAATGLIYVGTADGEILAWSLDTFALVRRVQAHKRAVLCLCLSSSSPSSSGAPPHPGTDSDRVDDDADAATDTPRTLLISSAGDPIINVWDPHTFARLYEIYGLHDVGDIFSVAHSVQRDAIYIGAQNTSIQWAKLGDRRLRTTHASDAHPDRRNHRFFDSKAVGGTATPRRSDERWARMPRARHVVEMDRGCMQAYAHFGFVFCMLVARGPTVLVDADEDVLISGGGDGTIKLWRLASAGPDPSPSKPWMAEGDETIEEILTLGRDDAESVLALALDGSFLYGGKLRGLVELWDLDTKQKLRVIKAHESDITTLQLAWGSLWTASRSGFASRHSTVHYGAYQNATSPVDQRFQCLSRWKAHSGNILASSAARYDNENIYITGANDKTVAVWRVPEKRGQAARAATGATAGEQQHAQDNSNNKSSSSLMMASLGEFVSYKTISSRPEYAEDCRKGATFLGALFKKLGGQVEVLRSDEARNPVVLATFRGKLEPAERRKRILFYGHYDVVPADGKKGNWVREPFRMTGHDGYLHGRGVSDNKGPIMAALYATTDLMQAKALENDVVFLIEGEEESGSRGFADTVSRNKGLIGRVDYILLANSYWLDDDVPCLTYGLRGVLHATAEVRSPLPDKHSGVDGSRLLDEPVSDLTRVLGQLKGNKNRVMLPGFYDCVLPVTDEEEARYDDIASILMRRSQKGEGEEERERGPASSGRSATAAELKQSLMARWREPNLTIHRYRASGPDGGSIVSAHASAHISLRLVPGQEVDEVTASLRRFLEARFAELESANVFEVRIDNHAEPWLGEPGNDIFRVLEGAVMEAWADCFDAAAASEPASTSSSLPSPGAVSSSSDAVSPPPPPHKPKKPLYIREGGSIPAIRFLEKEFGAPAAHLPCGQSSDAAHLDNERLRVQNLLKSREIFRMVFARL